MTNKYKKYLLLQSIIAAILVVAANVNAQNNNSLDNSTNTVNPLEIKVENGRSIMTSDSFIHTEMRENDNDIMPMLMELLDTVDLNSEEIYNLAKEHKPVFTKKTNKEAEYIDTEIRKKYKKDKLNEQHLVVYLWLIKLLKTDTSEEIKSLLNTPLTEEYVMFFLKNKCEHLKSMLEFTYFGEENIKRYDRKTYEKLEWDFQMNNALFVLNCPDRKKWEPVDKILEKLDLKKSDHVLELNAFCGYYTTQIAGVLPNGSIDAYIKNNGHLEFMQIHCQNENIDNIKIHSLDDLEVNKNNKNKYDVIFLNQYYHLIYTEMKRDIQKSNLEFIARTVKPGGRLVIVDSSPFSVPLGYTISPKLIQGQLMYYGFKLTEQMDLNKNIFYQEYVKIK